jgi:hypothetical protein
MLMYADRRLKLPRHGREVHVLVFGASAKAEIRILKVYIYADVC